MITEKEQALSELDRVITFLEAKLPGSLASPENIKLIKSLKKNMQDYFSQLDKAIDWNALETLYYNRVGR